MIGVLLVDDHALIRRGLSELIATAEGITLDAGPEGRTFGVAAGRHLAAPAVETCWRAPMILAVGAQFAGRGAHCRQSDPGVATNES